MQPEGWLIVMDDCLDALRAMPAGSVGVSPTSPPYNIGVDYNQHNDQMPRGAYLAWLGVLYREISMRQARRTPRPVYRIRQSSKPETVTSPGSWDSKNESAAADLIGAR
jgi:hypothetical protein